MSTRIVTDSTCDLPQAVVQEHGITVIPLYVNFGDQSYLDGVELSRRQFYEMLPDYESPPTTAVPGTDVFTEVYERLAAEGATDVLSLHVSSTVSATYDVARVVAQDIDAVPVTAFDGRQITVGTGLQVLQAAEAAAAGRSVAEIVAMLEEMVPRIHSFAALDTVVFLRRSGRVTALQYGLSTLLSIKPLIMMHNGEMAGERIRTGKGCVARMIEFVRDLGPLEQLALVHTNAPDAVEDLRSQVADLVPEGKESYIVEVTPVIGSHVGPGAVGLVAVQAR
ncbi:MAG: DegV family protein [Anaerolineae bacterium]